MASFSSSSSFAFSWAPPLRSSPPRRPASSSPPPSRDHVSAAGHSRSKSVPSPRLMGNWRTNAAPLPLPPSTSPPPPSRPECRLGLVAKLPMKHEVPVTSIFHQEVAGKATGHPWNHPVVITGVSGGDGKQLVSIRSCTSWGGQGIEARKQAKHHHYHVEADESQLCVDSGKFDKRTWVNCSPGHELTIEFEHLQVWTGKAIQFRQSAVDSFNKNLRVRRDSAFEA